MTFNKHLAPHELRFSILRDTWQEFARCRGEGPQKFFPTTGEDTSEALAMCEECPVRQPCYELGDAIGAPGIWGGTTERQRRQIRSRRSRGESER